MSAIGVQSQINKDRALWLSSIPTDVIHGNVICDTIYANAGFISTLYSDNINVSTLNASSLNLVTSDVSGMYVSSLRGNTAFFSSLILASDLSGGVGTVTFQVDASGIAVSGDPIVFNNLVYLTSTINIVQVSTIVDTDIFASNGYFSTLSSGSLSSALAHISSLRVEDLSANDGAFNTLSVSSLATNHISSLESGSNWSLWPTQASSIIFQPAYILSNVNNQLFFAGQELTDASGGGIDWSYFPAQTDVSMNNFSVRGLSTLQYQDGARLYSQTGNNLFYNGQPVQFGAASNITQWANFPAVNTIQTGGFPISSLGNINMVANSNVRILADSFSTVVDQGIDIASYADINLTAQNGNKGRINLTANTGYQGLFGEINMVANGGTVAGVGTGGLVTITANTPVGTLSNATSAIKLSASGVNSYAGAIPSVGSLAGYNFIYGTGGVNICAGLPAALPNIPGTTFLYGTFGVTTSSDFYVPNIYPYWNGVTTPPDMNITGRYIVPNLAQVYVNMSNVKRIYMDSFAEIQNARYVSTVSTVGQNANFNTGTFGTLAAGAVGASAGLFTTLDAGTMSTSYLQAPLLSTININLSTINGVDWQDISGSVFTTTSSFNTLFTSSLTLSSMSQVGGFPISIQGSLKFQNPDAIDNLTVINLNPLTIPQLDIGASTIYLDAVNTTTTSLSTQRVKAVNLYTSSISSGVSYADTSIVSSLSAVAGFPIKVNSALQFSGLDAIDNVTVINLNPLAVPQLDIGASTILLAAANTFTQSLSTLRIAANFIKVSTLNAPAGTIDVSGGMTMTEPLYLPLSNSVQFDDGSLVTFSQFQYRDVANNSMVALTNTNGLAPVPGSNMKPLGVGELWVTGASDQYAALRLYTEFPYNNFGMDIMDENGSLLFETLYCYEDSGGYKTGIFGVSSITGYTAVGGQSAVGVDNIFTAQLVSSTSLKYTSTIEFFNSNTNFTVPIQLVQDTAGGANGGVMISVEGRSLSQGAVRHVLNMGYRASDGANFIQAVWPGQNLEDLAIEGEPVTITDGALSTIFNTQPYALQTTQPVGIGAGSGLVTISTNNVKVGGQTQLTKDTISTTFLNTPYGNNLYYAGYRQPNIQWGTVATSGASGSQQVQINTPYYETISDYVVQVSMADSTPAEMSVSTQSKSSFTVYWANGGGGSHNINWTTFGDIPFTG